MRKSVFADICVNKDADQLVFVFALEMAQSLDFLNFKRLAIFCGCAAWYMSDLDGNPEDRVSPDDLIENRRSLSPYHVVFSSTATAL